MSEIAYHREGSGEPLLLTHGIGERWHYWLPCLPALAEHYDVVAVDLPGFGASPELPRPYGLDDVRRAVEGLLDELGWETAHVSGISFGGWLSLQLGIHGRARSVTAFSPAGLLKPGLPTRQAMLTLQSIRLTTRALLPALDAISRSALGRRAVGGVNAARCDRIPPEVFAGDIRAAALCPGWDPVRAGLKHCDITDSAALQDIPTTVAFGTRDLILPPKRQDRSRLPATVSWVDLPGCGHTPTWDDPALVVRTIETTTSRAAVSA